MDPLSGLINNYCDLHLNHTCRFRKGKSPTMCTKQGTAVHQVQSLFVLLQLFRLCCEQIGSLHHEQKSCTVTHLLYQTESGCRSRRPLLAKGNSTQHPLPQFQAVWCSLSVPRSTQSFCKARHQCKSDFGYKQCFCGGKNFLAKRTKGYINNLKHKPQTCALPISSSISLPYLQCTSSGEVAYVLPNNGSFKLEMKSF